MPRGVSKKRRKTHTAAGVYNLLALNNIKRRRCSLNRVQMEIHGGGCWMNGARGRVGEGCGGERRACEREGKKDKKMDV